MSQKTIIFGALLAGFVFIYGYILELATMRMLIVRSLLAAVGSIVAIVVARQGIDTIVSPSDTVQPPMEDLNLEEVLAGDEEGEVQEESGQEPEDNESFDQADPLGEVESADTTNVDTEDLQEDLEEQVKKGNEEGVQEIADLISDSMDS